MAIEAASLFVKVSSDTREGERGLQRVEDAAHRVNRKFGVMDEIITGALRDLGVLGVRAFGNMAREMAQFAGDTVNVGAEFDATMSGVQAILDPTIAEFDALRAAALEMGGGTSFTTREAAAGIEMLGRNGLNTSQILGGALQGSLSLAAATGSELAMSADVATDTLSVFGLQAKDMSQAVDLITGATVNSKFTLDDFRLALAQGGGVASASGVEFGDFATTIAGIAPLFGSGSDAGTAYKVMLQRLVPASKPAADMMRELGILAEDGSNAFFDAQGNLKSMSEISGILNTALAGLSEEQQNAALSTIFGTDAMRAAIGVARLGSDGFDELALKMGAVDAEAQAMTRLDNLAGDMQLLGSAVEALQIRVSDLLAPALRILAQRATEVVNATTALIDHITAAQDPVGELIIAVDELIPGFAGFANFVRDNLDPILLGLRLLFQTIASTLAVQVVRAIAVMLASFALTAAPIAAMILASTALKLAWATNFAGIQDIVTGSLAVVRETFANTVQFVQSLWATLGPTILEDIRTIWSQIESIIGLVLAVVVELTSLSFGGMAKTTKTHHDTIQSVVFAAWNAIRGIIELQLVTIQGVLQALLLGLRGDWGGAWAMLRDTTLNLVAGLRLGVLGQVGALIQSLVGQIIAAVPTIIETLGAWAAAFAGWILDAWAMLRNRLRSYLSNLGGWIEGAATWLTERFFPWVAAFAEWWLLEARPRLTVQLGAFLGQVLDWIGNALTVLVPQLGTWGAAFWKWIMEVWPQWLANALTLMSQLLDWIYTRVPIIATALRGWAEVFWRWFVDDGFPQLWAALTTALETLGTWIQAEGPTLAGHLGEWALAFIEWALPAFARLVTTLGELFGTYVLPWLSEMAPVIAYTLLSWAVAFAGWVLVEAVPRLLGALGQMALILIDWLIAKSGDIAAEGSVGRAIVDGIWGGIVGAWAGFMAWLWDLTDSILAPFYMLFDRMWSVAGGLIDSFRMALAFGWDGVIDWVSEQIWRLPDMLAMAYDAMWDTANSLVGGFWDGLETAWDDMLGWVNDLSNELIGALEKAFGIQSPSKEAAKRLGLPFGEGIAQGIKDSRKALMESLGTVEDVLTGQVAVDATTPGPGMLPPASAGNTVTNITNNTTQTVNMTTAGPGDPGMPAAIMRSLA